MKLSKQKLKQIINEEIEIILEDGDLTSKEVAGAWPHLTTGEVDDEWERLSEVPRDKYPDTLKKHLGMPLDESIEEIIMEELSDYLSNIYKWCPAGTKCPPEKKKTKWWKGTIK